MRMTILKKKTGYAIGLILCIVGVAILLFLAWRLWEEWPTISASPNLLSAFATRLMEGSYSILAIELKLIHYTVLGFALLITGIAILLVRREKVVVTEETIVLLECRYCKNQWRESMSKTHLKTMGYPSVRTLSRRKCSKCAKFIRPKIVTIDL